ncbi:hypothetical protein DD595_26310, partial [Enterobacter cloacae complex sp. 4DZ3-17B2]|uniref:hypothetical protein n=1 Tax=Enterobacter cloacae complex sp. 4DZ3-17B2 TaxID=2511990 RepID=UPI001025B36C
IGYCDITSQYTQQVLQFCTLFSSFFFLSITEKEKEEKGKTEIQSNNIPGSMTNVENSQGLELTEHSISEPDDPSASETVLKALGMDLVQSKFKEVKYHSGLINIWSKWTKEGLPEKNKKEILELYK